MSAIGTIKSIDTNKKIITIDKNKYDYQMVVSFTERLSPNTEVSYSYDYATGMITYIKPATAADRAYVKEFNKTYGKHSPSHRVAAQKTKPKPKPKRKK